MQEAQARRNAASKEVGQAKAKKDKGAAKGLKAEVSALKGTIPEGEAREEASDEELEDHLAAIPNMPQDDVPVGADERQGRDARTGSPRNLPSSPSSISSSAKRLA